MSLWIQFVSLLPKGSNLFTIFATMDAIIANYLTQNQTPVEENQALVVIGLQNDFISPDGKLPVSLDSGFLERIKILVPKFREFAGYIIWIRSEFSMERLGLAGAGNLVGDMNESEFLSDQNEGAGDGDLKSSSKKKKKKKKKSKSGVNKAVQFFKDIGKKEQNSIPDPVVQPEEEEELYLSKARQGSCPPGSSGAAFASEMDGLMRPEDTVIVKSHYSAFNETNLNFILRSTMVTELYIVGCMTNLSVYATAQDAASHGLQLNLVEDCLGYWSQERHNFALQTMVEGMGANLTTSTAILAVFDGQDEEEQPLSDINELNAAFGGLDLMNKNRIFVQPDDLPVTGLAESLASANLSAGGHGSLISSPAHLRPPTAQPFSESQSSIASRPLRSYQSSPDVRSRANVRVRVRTQNKNPVPELPKTALSILE